MKFHTTTLAEAVFFTGKVLNTWIPQPSDDERENLKLSGARWRQQNLAIGVVHIQYVLGPNHWLCTFTAL